MIKKLILVVEDDTVSASLLSDKLVSAGFEAEVAIDGEKGLEATKKKPDLILLDIMLPKMDGLTLMKAIREGGEWGAQVPIIITSNLSPDDEAIDKVATYSPVFYLMKAEHSLDDIVEKTKEVLKLK